MPVHAGALQQALQRPSGWRLGRRFPGQDGAIAPFLAAMAPPLLWFLSGCLLLVLALVGLDNDGLLLVAGVSGLLLTLLASLVAVPLSLQLLLFSVLVGLGYGLLRSLDRRARDRQPPIASGGERAEVISGFQRDDHGRVRWQGQSWAAVNLAPEQDLQTGQAVTVMGREGTRLQVLPR